MKEEEERNEVMIRERVSRVGKYADTRVLGTERMVFSSIKRSEAIIDKASTEENNQSQDQVRDGDGAKGREDIREGVGINIDKAGEKNSSNAVSDK